MVNPCGFGGDEQVIKPGSKILRFSHEKTGLKKPNMGMKTCGKILGRFFFFGISKIAMFDYQRATWGVSFKRFLGNQWKCWSRERRHWAQPVEKTCNPIFSSHDIWKGLQNRMLQIQFLICAGFPSLTEHQMNLVDGFDFAVPRSFRLH